MNTNAKTATKTHTNMRKLTMTAVMAAVATVLMFLEIPVGIMPSFIKLDFSELPALVAAFSMGPLSGALVCLLKNLLHLLVRNETMGIGELSNLLLGLMYVLPAGFVYKFHKNRGGALLASLVGSLSMGVLGVFSNYWIIYPLYIRFMMPEQVILGLYQVINPNVTSLWRALWMFNAPFTFVKGLLDAGICFMIYKRISPLLKGKA